MSPEVSVEHQGVRAVITYSVRSIELRGARVDLERVLAELNTTMQTALEREVDRQLKAHVEVHR